MQSCSRILHQIAAGNVPQPQSTAETLSLHLMIERARTLDRQAGLVKLDPDGFQLLSAISDDDYEDLIFEEGLCFQSTNFLEMWSEPPRHLVHPQDWFNPLWR